MIPAIDGGRGRLHLGRMEALLAIAAASWLAADSPWSLQADLGVTLVQPPVTSSAGWRVANSSMAGVTCGYRWRALDAFLRAEIDHWSDAREDGSRDQVLALNAGPGAAFTYAGGRVRSSLAGGLSVLLEPTDIDRAGSTGVFVDLRPITLRWPVAARTWIGVTPLSLTVMMPVLTGIPLVQLEYRTSIQAEFGL
jgi:hypothetical protein